MILAVIASISTASSDVKTQILPAARLRGLMCGALQLTAEQASSLRPTRR